MIEFFVRRPVTTIMFVSVFIVLGLVSFFNLRVEETPEIDFPIVTVTATYPGATPLEIETLVVNKIEDAVAELSDIKQIRSQAYDNFGYVFVEFLMSSDVNIKLIEVKDKVEAILNDLPEDMEKPVIAKYDPLMVPVLDLVLSSDKRDGRDLYEFADKKLKDRFSSIGGVANVDIYGGKKRQINVILDPMLMKQRYITIRDVINSIAAKNKNVPGGLLEKGNVALSLRFLGEFKNPQEIAEMTVISQDGRSFPLKEIARVEDSFKKVETMARFNGKDVVGLSLKKVSDGNAIDIAKQVRLLLDEFRALLPEGVTLEIATDTTDFIITETNDTYLNILTGILLTVVILYLFTGRASLTVITSIAIPTSIVSTLFLMDISGFTVNMMTLLGIATVLGTLISNAIIIVENVLVHLDKGDDHVQASINGTKEVTTAIWASAGTNLVVFTPIAFMSGMIGQFFQSFGLTVVYATLFSILASFSLTPMLCSLMLRKRAPATAKKHPRNPFIWMFEKTNKAMDFLKAEYQKIFTLIFRFPKSTVGLIVLMILSMQHILPYIANDFMPIWDEDIITVKIEMPQGSTIDRTLEVTKIVEKRIQDIPEKESYLTSIGEDGVENSAIVINLIPSSKRKRSDADIINELIPFVAQIPDAEIMLERGESRGMVTGDISIDVYGVDYQKMIDLSNAMKQGMEESGYFRGVKSSYRTPKNEVRFIPDQKRLIEHGIQDIVIGDTIRSSVYGNDDNVYKEGGEEYDINVELDDRYAEDMDDISQIDVITKKGMVPVVELGTLQHDKSIPMIRHRDKQRAIRLEGYLAKSNTGYVMSLLDQEIFKDIQFEKGYSYKYVEMAERGAESSQEIGKAFILAVILTYMLLCALSNSFSTPLVILSSVATSFIGIFLALFFLEGSINIASMLGMVMVVGLVVNNSILLLDYTELKMKEGVPVVEALWLGASTKFRAIIMTSLAIVLGVLPQLGSGMPHKSSMGMVMMGGLLASIFFTFIFTPVAYWYVDLFRKKLAFHKRV
ncbi:MAG: efflux RND transporter permease subunit [Candidatus Omnitrophota bacterium]|jgi:HAE1 family hydrophobic/amphiphilic exporter-1